MIHQEIIDVIDRYCNVNVSKMTISRVLNAKEDIMVPTEKTELSSKNILYFNLDESGVPLRQKSHKVLDIRHRLLTAYTGRTWNKSKKEMRFN